MTREQLEARAQMAMAAGVFSYGDWWDTLRQFGWRANLEIPTDKHILDTLNYLLEENNVLTATPLQLSGSSC